MPISAALSFGIGFDAPYAISKAVNHGTPVGYIYLTRIDTARRVLWYVGKKHSAVFDKEYNGSGRVVSFIRKKRGKSKMKTRAIAWAHTEDELNSLEKMAIARARAKYGKLCVNSADGGDGLSPAAARKVLNTPSVKARHLAGVKAANAEPEINARRSVAMKALLSSPEKKAMLSERSKKAWADPEARARRVASLNEAAKRPDVKARLTAGMKARYADPAYKERCKAVLKSVWDDPAYRSRMAAIRKAMWSDPDFKARRAAAHSSAINSPEYRAKLSSAAKAMWSDPEAKGRRLAANANKRKAKIATGPEVVGDQVAD